MKDNLFDMLMRLFDQTLTKIKATSEMSANGFDENQSISDDEAQTYDFSIINSPNGQSVRVFTEQETIKLTKQSYQLLIRLNLSGVLSSMAQEEVLNLLLLSDSQYIHSDEILSVVREVLLKNYPVEQSEFVDMLIHTDMTHHAMH